MWTPQQEARFYRMLSILPLVGGLVLFGWGLADGSAWRIVTGLAVALVGSWSPRLVGKVEIAMGALKFKGELVSSPDEKNQQPELPAAPPEPNGE